MTPTLGGHARAGTRYRLRPGAYAVIAHPRGLLLTVQEDAVEGPEVQLPGGGVDPGEGPLAALHREAREETGWTIHAPRWLATVRRFAWMPEYRMHAEKVCHVFLARAGIRRGPPEEPGHSVLVLPPEEALRALGVEGDRHVLAAAMRLGRV